MFASRRLWNSQVILFLLCACGDDDKNNGGHIVANSSTLKSSSLLNLMDAKEACSSSEKSCTPRNLEGRIFAAGALLGRDSDSSKNFNMTFLADTDDIIQNPSSTAHTEGRLIFDLQEPSVFSGRMSIPEEENMPTIPSVSRLETYFDFIDATFTLSGTKGIDGTYTIRTVFRKTASTADVSGEMVLGDKLLKVLGSKKFFWCDSSTCGHTTRPKLPLQDDEIVDIDSKNDGQPSNANYVLYSIDLKEDVTFSYAQLSDASRLWSMDLEVEDSMSFAMVPASMDSLMDMVDSFHLEFGCNSSGCAVAEKRIRANLGIGEVGSAD